MNGLQQRCWWGLATACSLFVLFHFFVIFINQMPANPVQYQLYSLSSKYMFPFFGQDWHLFAPNPINSNIIVVARGYGTPSNRFHRTKWIDLTDGLIRAVQQNRFTSVQLTEFLVTTDTMDLAKNLTVTANGQSLNHIEVKRRAQMAVQSPEAQVLIRYATTVLKADYPQAHFHKIQLALIVSVPPDFLQRVKPDSSSKVDTIMFPPVKTPSILT